MNIRPIFIILIVAILSMANTTAIEVPGLTEAEALRACQRNSYYFGKYVLNYPLLSPAQFDMASEIVGEPRVNLLAPRGCLKTTLLSVTGLLHDLAADPTEQIMIGSESGTKSNRILDEARTHLQANRKLAWYSPELIRRFTGVRFDRSNEFKFEPEGDELVSKDPTAATFGVGTTATSGHFSKAFCDDLNTVEDLDSEANRNAKIRWFKELKNILNPGGGIVNIQTRWHDRDVAGYIIAECPEYKTVIYDIYGNKRVRLPYADPEDWTKTNVGRPSQIPGDEDGLLFYPEKYHHGHGDIKGPDGIIRKGLATLMGDPANWITQYLNDPHADEFALFKSAWYEPAPVGALDIGSVDYIVAGVDWAASEKETADYNAIIGVAVDKNGNLWIIDAWLGRGADYINYLKDFDNAIIARWKQAPVTYYVEANGMQLGIAKTVGNLTGLPWEAAPELSSSKPARARMQAAYWREGRIRILGGTRHYAELKTHYINFPAGTNKDFVDAGGNVIIPVCRGVSAKTDVSSSNYRERSRITDY